MTAHPFRPGTSFDAATAAQAFARDGRVQIPGFLDRSAADTLAAHLHSRSDWRHVLNGSKQVFEIKRGDHDAMPAEQKLALDRAIHAAAAEGFQFRYDSVRVADELPAAPPPAGLLERFATDLRSDGMLALFRGLTGLPIVFADAQATMYRPGDFLTEHDDDVAGKDRLAAYVLNLSPRWRIEWGGMLLFHGADGDVEHGYLPRYASLNLFRVPQRHSVSLVTPFAQERRLAVTGWLRSKAPDLT